MFNEVDSSNLEFVGKSGRKKHVAGTPQMRKRKLVTRSAKREGSRKRNSHGK